MRAVATFGADHPIDRLTGPDLRAWLVELRTTLAPVSVAGYVRTLKAFGNWLQTPPFARSELAILISGQVHDPNPNLNRAGRWLPDNASGSLGRDGRVPRLKRPPGNSGQGLD